MVHFINMITEIFVRNDSGKLALPKTIQLLLGVNVHVKLIWQILKLLTKIAHLCPDYSFTFKYDALSSLNFTKKILEFI